MIVASLLGQFWIIMVVFLDNNVLFFNDLGEKKERFIDLYAQHTKLHLATTVTF